MGYNDTKGGIMKRFGIVLTVIILCFTGCNTDSDTGNETTSEISVKDPPLLTSIAEVIKYLANNDGQSPDDPIKLSVKIYFHPVFGADIWEELFEAIVQADDFVALDLSQCQNVPQLFRRPGAAPLAADKIVSLVLPEGIATFGDLMPFLRCTNLRQVTLPQSLTKIGGATFSGCTNLTRVICPATTPPDGGENMFYGCSGFTIEVPPSSVQLYKTAAYWSDYKDKIVPP